MAEETDATTTTTGGSNLLPERIVIYCGACGMPPEYCEYGPDFETHCDPWLRRHHPELRQKLAEERKKRRRGTKTDPKQRDGDDDDGAAAAEDRLPKPDRPWTTEQRLTAFYEKYQPDKVDSVPGLLEKYAGKEDKLFEALTKKYGPEPKDPYFSDSDSEEEGAAGSAAGGGRRSGKRRGVGAKQTGEEGTFAGRVVVQKQVQKKKRVLTVVTGLEPALAVNHHRLKDASKAFSRRFAGSSSVQKDGSVILQGDHCLELAVMLVDKFQVPEECVYVDLGDGSSSLSMLLG